MVRRSTALLFLAVILSQLASGCCWCYRPLFNRFSSGPLLGAPIGAPAPVISGSPAMGGHMDIGHSAPVISGPVSGPGCVGCGASSAAPFGGPIIAGGPMMGHGPIAQGPAPMPNGYVMGPSTMPVGAQPIASAPMTSPPVLLGSSSGAPGYMGFTSTPTSLGAPVVTQELSHYDSVFRRASKQQHISQVIFRLKNNLTPSPSPKRRGEPEIVGTACHPTSRLMCLFDSSLNSLTLPAHVFAAGWCLGRG
jgi:hypothetical protein